MCFERGARGPFENIDSFVGGACWFPVGFGWFPVGFQCVLKGGPGDPLKTLILLWGERVGFLLDLVGFLLVSNVF